MACTRTLQRSINWVKPILKNQPLDFNNMEPALEAGNIVMQTILGAPLAWPFNRSTLTFTTTAPVPPLVPAVADYNLTLPDFGYLEDQWIIDARGNTHALSGAFSLPMPPSSSLSRPSAIAAQKDDNKGCITMRTKEMPNAAYTIGGDYQRKAPKLLSVGQVLAPIPDEMSYIFDLGFLSLLGMLVSDARVDWWEKKFIGRLLSRQDGLDAVAVNIFLGLWETNAKTMMRAQTGTQTAAAGRAGS